MNASLFCFVSHHSFYPQVLLIGGRFWFRYKVRHNSNQLSKAHCSDFYLGGRFVATTFNFLTSHLIIISWMEWANKKFSNRGDIQGFTNLWQGLGLNLKWKVFLGPRTPPFHFLHMQCAFISCWSKEWVLEFFGFLFLHM